MNVATVTERSTTIANHSAIYPAANMENALSPTCAFATIIIPDQIAIQSFVLRVILVPTAKTAVRKTLSEETAKKNVLVRMVGAIRLAEDAIATTAGVGQSKYIVNETNL